MSVCDCSNRPDCSPSRTCPCSTLTQLITIERAPLSASATKSLGLGFFRLALGFVFGAVAVLAAWTFMATGDDFDRGVLAYLVFLVPVRALEWWITARMIGRTSASANVPLWVLGGVVLSCMADIPTYFAVVDLFSGLC